MSGTQSVGRNKRRAINRRNKRRTFLCVMRNDRTRTLQTRTPNHGPVSRGPYRADP